MSLSRIAPHPVRSRLTRVAIAATLVAAAAATGALAESTRIDAEKQWPRFRGPLDTGVAPEADPPVEWSETRNVRFKVPIPGNGLASPIVWGERIFLTSAVPVDDGAYASSRRAAEAKLEREEWPPSVDPVPQKFVVMALSTADGRELWQKTAATRTPHETHYIDASWASASPVTDGERLIAHFGSNGTYAYDLDGNLLWSLDLGDMETRRGFGEGSSPVLWEDTVVINWDHEGASFVVALDADTGEERWRVERPDEPTSWSTPVVVEREGEAQVVIASTGASRGYDLKTGRERWRLSGMTVNAIPTPAVHEDVVYLTSGFRGNKLQAVDLSRATGDVAGTDALLWERDRDTPYVPSPLLVGDRLYFLKSYKNIWTCVDAATGRECFDTARLPGISNVYASPVAADGRIYVFDRSGSAIVLEDGETLKVLAQNELDEGVDATPAPVGKTLYVRGTRHLYAIGGP